MNKNRIISALAAIIIYEVLFNIISPDGLSSIKIAITLMIWISLYQSFIIFLTRFSQIRAVIPDLPFMLFITILAWNIINIFRSAFDSDNTVTTLLGNPITSLALLVPFSLSFCIEKENLKTVLKMFIFLILICIPAYFVFWILAGIPNNLTYNMVFRSMTYGTFFLITLMPFQTKKINLLILLGSAFLFFIAMKTEYRTMMLRMAMLFVAALAVFLYMKFKLKTILIIAFFVLFIPFFLLFDSIKTGTSAFQKYLVYVKDPMLSTDTRTFLYTEVYDDLKQNNMLRFGKGSVARYYSPYFAEQDGDYRTRLSVEVGILAMLLTGGLLAVILNIILFIIAIYLSLFKSENFLSVSLGFVLIVHTILLFIESYLVYSLYNIVIWFIVGLCLSKEIRSLSNAEIYNFFKI
jgi:hypothetical protein